MKCPYCGYVMSKVLNSRPVDENKSIRRRRQCEKCEKRFTTYEKIESIPVMVIKSNHTREAFDREKLFQGIVRACNKRHISMEQIEELVDQIENQIYLNEEKEIRSSEIGQLAMHYLRQLDEVSYVRFASIYKEFKDIDEFVAELEYIKKQNNKDNKKS